MVQPWQCLTAPLPCRSYIALATLPQLPLTPDCLPAIHLQSRRNITLLQLNTLQAAHQVAVTAVAVQAEGQQQELLLAELKRVGTQQEHLKRAVSEAAAEAAARGQTFEIAPLKSFKLSDSELAHLKGLQLKDQLKMTKPEATVAFQAPEEEAPSSSMRMADVTTLPLADAPAPNGEPPPTPSPPQPSPPPPNKATVPYTAQCSYTD